MTDTPQSVMGWHEHGQGALADAHAFRSAKDFHSTRNASRHDSRDPSRAFCSHPGLNLFKRTEEQDIICAVLEDCPVPTFLQDPAWAFAGRLDWETATPPGFDLRAARSACNNLGFYLFQTWARA